MTSFAVLEDKVRKAFRFFDVNGDGLVTREECILYAHKLCDLSQCSKSEKEVTRAQWTGWADTVFPEGQIDVTRFVEIVIQLVKTVPAAIRQGNLETYGDMFDRLDANKDNFISMDELALYYKAFGYDNREYVEMVFKALDKNEDGLVSREEFAGAFAVYWSNESGFEFLYDPI